MPPSRWRRFYSQYEPCEADEEGVQSRRNEVSARDCVIVFLYTILGLGLGILFVIVKVTMGINER
jgi:hypothetical protein